MTYVQQLEAAIQELTRQRDTAQAGLQRVIMMCPPAESRKSEKLALIKNEAQFALQDSLPVSAYLMPSE